MKEKGDCVGKGTRKNINAGENGEKKGM